MKSAPEQTTLRMRREWTLLWFGVIREEVWNRMDSDRIVDPRTLQAPPTIIYRGPIGDLLDNFWRGWFWGGAVGLPAFVIFIIVWSIL